MPAATASGVDAGAAKNREHNQGNQERKFTVEQKAAVIRVRKCAHEAFYEILGVERAVSDADIKKAYRKLSLLTHPDKNGYDGADEAFKMVSRAFQVLSDKEKKEKYDRFGGDPDSRFGQGSASPASPFSGFRQSAAGRSPFESEISPEELFNQFFGGGMGGNDMFGGGGSQFVFNLGGGPGFRVHQFGGARPRRRPREATAGEEARPQSATSILTNLLPLLILFILPLLSSFFSADSAATPSLHFEGPRAPHTLHRVTPRYKVNYYLNPSEVAGWNGRDLTRLDSKAESTYISSLQYECGLQKDQQNRMMQDAQGWFRQDPEKMRLAQSLELTTCKKLRKMGIATNY